MYVPQHHEEQRLDVLHGLIRSQPLATWVTLSGGELVANLVPFLLDASRGPGGVLRAHVARANPVWKTAAEHPSLLVFQGPQAYITPSWYPSKHEHGMAVPTWNYVVVQARGRARVIEDRDWLLAHVGAMTDTQEAAQALPWRVSDAPADFTARMLGAIVGIEIPIDSLTGKWKVSQNRPAPDRLGVVAGLMGRGDTQSAQMAALVRDSKQD
jgi:transcriptional regulator